MVRWTALILAVPALAQPVHGTARVSPVQDLVRREIEANRARLKRYTLTWQMEISQVTQSGIVRNPTYLQLSWELRNGKPCLFGVLFAGEPPPLQDECLNASTSGEVPFEAAQLVLTRAAASVTSVTLPDGRLGYLLEFLPQELRRRGAPEENCRNSAAVRVWADALSFRLVESEARIVSPGCRARRNRTQPLLAPGSVMTVRYLTEGEVNIPFETDETLVRFEDSAGPQIWFGRTLKYDPNDPDQSALVAVRLLNYERRSVLRVNPVN